MNEYLLLARVKNTRARAKAQALFYRYFLCTYHFVAFVDVDEIQSAGLVADIDWRLAVAKGLRVHGLPYGVAQRHVFALVRCGFEHKAAGCWIGINGKLDVRYRFDTRHRCTVGYGFANAIQGINAARCAVAFEISGITEFDDVAIR